MLLGLFAQIIKQQMIHKIFTLFKNPLPFLIIILVISFGLRLYKIDNAVADWHSWRQADTASVARNFFKEKFNPFLPKYDDMSAISDTGRQNLARYRMVEFPIYPSLVYFSYLINGGVDEKLARLINIFFSLGSIIFVYLIAKRYFGVFIGLVSAATYGLLPFNVFFSRAILPEASLVLFSLGMFYFLDKWIYENKGYILLIGLMFMSLAFLTKPMALFYMLPLSYSYLQKEKKFFPIPKRYFLILIGFLPFIFWRLWISNYPDGIPQSSWLFNGNGIRFRPAFWRWIIGDRFGREIFSVTGTFLVFLGLLIRPTPKQTAVLYYLALSMFLYLIVFATGNVQHDYYQYMIVPPLSIFLSKGFVDLLQGKPYFIPRIWTIPLAILFLTLTFYFTFNEVKGLYQINNNSIVIAGEAANKLLPKDAFVVAPYFGDTAFLYQINRPGFPIVLTNVEDMVKRFGITHYVSVNFDAKTNWLMEKYKVVDKSSVYVIVDLRRVNPEFIENKTKEELKEPL